MQTTRDNKCSCEHRGRENIFQIKVAHWDSAAKSVTHMSATHWSAWNPLCVSASWLPATADHSPSTPSHSHTRSAVAEVHMSTFQPFDSSTAVLSCCLCFISLQPAPFLTGTVSCSHSITDDGSFSRHLASSPSANNPCSLSLLSTLPIPLYPSCLSVSPSALSLPPTVIDTTHSWLPRATVRAARPTPYTNTHAHKSSPHMDRRNKQICR